MTIDGLLNIFLSFFPWGFLKLGILILILLYVAFAVIIVRQETLMAKVIEVPANPILKVVALSHLIAALAIFVLALVLL